MPNHLTPEELSREFGIERAEVIRICVEEHVPVYHGRIDKTLFEAVRHIHEPQQVHATSPPPDGTSHPEAGRSGPCSRAQTLPSWGARPLLASARARLRGAGPAGGVLGDGVRGDRAPRARRARRAVRDARGARRAPATAPRPPQARLARVRSELRSVRERLGVARSNQRAAQRALAQRLNEIYRAHPLDTLGVLLASRSCERHQRRDSTCSTASRARTARSSAPPAAGARRSRASRARCARPRRARKAEQAAWQARVAELQRADRAPSALLVRRLRREHVRSLDGADGHGTARCRPCARGRPAAAARRRQRRPPRVPPAPPAPSLAAGTTLSVASTAYSLPGHTASGLPVGPGHLRDRPARDPARERASTCRATGRAWPPTPARA